RDAAQGVGQGRALLLHVWPQVLLDEDHPGGPRLRRRPAYRGGGPGAGGGDAGQVHRIPSERFAAVPEGLTGSLGTSSTSSMSGRVSDAAFSSTPADGRVLVPPGDPAFHMGVLPVRADRLG